MIDFDLIDKYVEQYKTSNSEVKNELRTLLTRFFSQTTISKYSDFTRQDFVDVFSKLKIISTNTFETYRSKISYFVKWLSENGYASNQQINDLESISFKELRSKQQIFETYFFRDFDDLYNTMCSAFAERGSEFDTFRSAAILVWFGMEFEVLPEILKTDVLENESCIIHPIRRDKFFISDTGIDFIAKYRDADTFDSNRFGGCVMNYQKTDYLFRSYVTPHLTCNQLRHIINPANKVAKEAGKIFNWKSIDLSGIYYRIFQHEKEHGELTRKDYGILEEFFKKEDTVYRKRILSQKYDEYNEFKAAMLL